MTNDKATAAADLAACPICGLCLPMKELAIHVEQELSVAEPSGSAKPVLQSATLKQDKHANRSATSAHRFHAANDQHQKHKHSKSAALQPSKKASTACIPDCEMLCHHIRLESALFGLML